VAVASAGLYTSLHLVPDNHPNIPPLSFLQAGCPSYHPTNSVKALKGNVATNISSILYKNHTLKTATSESLYRKSKSFQTSTRVHRATLNFISKAWNQK